MNSPLRLKYPISVRYSSPRSRSRRAEYGVCIPVLSEMLTTRTLRPSKSTFPPCWAAPITSSCVIPVGLPSSVIRASLPTASELDSPNFALKLSENSRRHPKRGPTRHPNRPVRPVLDPIEGPDTRPERHSHPFSTPFRTVSRRSSVAGIIRVLCMSDHESPMYVHKKPCRIGPGRCQLPRIVLLGSRVNKRLTQPYRRNSREIIRG